MSDNEYDKPFINFNNIIKDKNGKFGIKDLDLLIKSIDESGFIENIDEKNKLSKIYWFKNKYQNIETLDDYLNKVKVDNNNYVNSIEMLVQDISRQIKFLESIGKTLVSINLNDIIVINSIFLLIHWMLGRLLIFAIAINPNTGKTA